MERAFPKMAIRHGTITGIVDPMVAAELVKGVRSEEDRRVWRMQRLSRVRSIVENVSMALWDLMRNSLHALPKDIARQLIALLAKLADQVKKRLATPSQATNYQTIS